MANTPTRSDPGVDGLIAAVVVAMVMGGMLWGAGALTAIASGHAVPSRRPFAGLAAFAHVGNPSAAWGAPVGPAAVYWAVTATVLAGAAGVGWLGWLAWHADRGSDDPTRIQGLADRRHVAAMAGSKALLARAATLRPSLPRPTPQQVGYFLGRSCGVECWASVEDSIVIVGPPRSGKGFNLVIPAILDAPGAVITTSTGRTIWRRRWPPGRRADRWRFSTRKASPPGCRRRFGGHRSEDASGHRRR